MSVKNRKYGILNILDIYIIRKLLATFLLAIGLIILIVIIFDLSEKLDDFIYNQAPVKGLIFDYYLNFVPYFVNLFGHLFFFISVVFVCSKLAARTETVAVLSSGISFARFLWPFILTSVLIGLSNVWLSNIVIPKVNKPRLEFEKTYYRNPYHNQFYNIHIQTQPQIQIYVQHYNNQTCTAYKFTQELIKDRHIVRKTSAEKIVYDSLSKDWIMYNYHIRDINGKRETVTTGNEKHIDIGLLPHEFNLNQIKTEVLDYSQLNATIEREKLKGSSIVEELKVEKYQRLLNPIAYIILTIIGVSLSSRKTRGGIGLSLALGIMLAFSLIMMMKLTKVFATNGTLPPVLAVILPLVIYSIIAGVLVLKAPK